MAAGAPLDGLLFPFPDEEAFFTWVSSSEDEPEEEEDEEEEDEELSLSLPLLLLPLPLLLLLLVALFFSACFSFLGGLLVFISGLWLLPFSAGLDPSLLVSAVGRMASSLLLPPRPLSCSLTLSPCSLLLSSSLTL